jgi:hypothetical protein
MIFLRYFHIIFQRQKVKKKSQNGRNQGFLLLNDRRIRISNTDVLEIPHLKLRHACFPQFTLGGVLGCQELPSEETSGIRHTCTPHTVQLHLVHVEQLK